MATEIATIGTAGPTEVHTHRVHVGEVITIYL